jgi:hypothetical protein
MGLLAIIQSQCYFQMALEQLCILVDQLNRQSITNYVKKTSKMTEKLLIKDRRKEDQKLNYWMPYMDMSNNVRKCLGLVLFIINALLAYFNSNIDLYVSILGSTTMPFISFILPGALYYILLTIDDEPNNKLKRIGCLIFCILGFLFILFYTTISVHELVSAGDEFKPSPYLRGNCTPSPLP